MPEHVTLAISAELNLENGEMNRSSDKRNGDIENTICIGLLDNPLDMLPEVTIEEPVLRYSAADVAWNTSQPIHMVTAWAFGKDIDRTYLLGMYE